jgi:hypothetical protein
VYFCYIKWLPTISTRQGKQGWELATIGLRCATAIPIMTMLFYYVAQGPGCLAFSVAA